MEVIKSKYVKTLYPLFCMKCHERLPTGSTMLQEVTLDHYDGLVKIFYVCAECAPMNKE